MQRVAVAATALAAVFGTACSGGDDNRTAVPPGAEVADRVGCAACHGERGEGVEGLGPAWVNLFGSTVELEDGNSVVADRAYLERSITEPDAQRVAGFTLQMPPYRLDEADLTALLDYIEGLR